MSYCVYRHISPSGKVYIGITGKKPEQRWQHGNGYKKNPFFYNAIVKYKWENFKHEILMDNLSKSEAIDLEKFFIFLYKSKDNKYGYNCTYGGDGVSGFKHTEDAKRKIGIASSLRKRSIETRKKISEAHKGKKGRKWTEEEYKIHSEKAKKQWQNPEYKKYMIEQIKIKNKGKKPVTMKRVRCIETQEIFESVAQASKTYNIQACHISGCCKGKRKTCGNKHWEYII